MPTITKSQVMAALKLIRDLKIHSRDEYDECFPEIEDPDIELYEAVSDAADDLCELRWRVRQAEPVAKVIEDQQKADAEKAKAQNEADKKKAREIEPQVKERAKAIGYELVKVHGATFFLSNSDTDTKYRCHQQRVHVSDIDEWLERVAGEQAEERSAVEAEAA
jgi:hypothetical protein